MIVRSGHFEFDREKSRELEQLAEDGTLSDEQRDLIAEADVDQPFFNDPASHCFYCGEKLTIPALMWNGFDDCGANPREVWMHPQCAEAFCMRLSRDIDELKLGKDRADEKLRDWKRRPSA